MIFIFVEQNEIFLKRLVCLQTLRPNMTAIHVYGIRPNYSEKWNKRLNV